MKASIERFGKRVSIFVLIIVALQEKGNKAAAFNCFRQVAII